MRVPAGSGALAVDRSPSESTTLIEVDQRAAMGDHQGSLRE